MSQNIERPMLGPELAMDSLGGKIEKKWSGGYEVAGMDVIIASIWVFHKGAILGLTQKDNPKPTIKIISQQGHEDTLGKQLKEVAEDIVKTNKGKANDMLAFTRLTLFPKIDFGDIEMLKALSKRKYRLGEIMHDLQDRVFLGIALGLFFPELVEELWHNQYEIKKDPKMYADARRHGLDLPEEQQLLPIDEMKKIVIDEVKAFVKENHSELYDDFSFES